MFARFNLKLDDDWFYDRKQDHSSLYSEKKQIQKSIENYIFNDIYLDASSIENAWFPNVDAKVFLSHSHKDENKVLMLQEYLLYEYGITSFVDSTVWGYADDLIRLIDEKNIDSNRTASFVYILLQSALVKMIDSCECLIFLNTPNSVLMNDVIRGTSTDSVWLYNELLMSSILKVKDLYVHRKDSISHSMYRPMLSVDLSHMIDLSISDFELAKERCPIPDVPEMIMDCLYSNKGIIKESSINEVLNSNGFDACSNGDCNE